LRIRKTGQLSRQIAAQKTLLRWRAAQHLLSRMQLAFEPILTRRSRRAAQPGRADWRATLQAMARHGGELWDTRWRKPRTRPAPLVLLATSGSMSRCCAAAALRPSAGPADAR
jgi:uncharacterized protein with von Willebrand factor type A (vWA) domain